MRNHAGLFALLTLLAVNDSGGAVELPIVEDVAYQPLVSATGRLIDALRHVGAPLEPADETAVKAFMNAKDPDRSVRGIQEVLDRYCVLGVNINPESRVKVAEGPARKELVQQGWRSFLVKVHNEAGVTAVLSASSPNAEPQFRRSRGSSEPDPEDRISAADVAQRFLDIVLYDGPPLKPSLSGLELEYRIIQLYSRDVGKREARLAFDVGQGSQDLGFRNETAILFHCVPAVEVSLAVLDHDGQPTSAAFVIRDTHGRVYPNPARRLAPDFFFHDQIYRADGESVHLPPGDYTVSVSRGPEYQVETQALTVPAGVVSHEASFTLSRWMHAAKRRWFSGDHHVHAAGCAHYENPTEGVAPADMMRHILGEDLNVGCVLSWGPCWYTQKQYFEGKTSALSRPNYLMRYDVEVSGFPSSHAGHLCLLRLKEDDYPETTRLEEWPSWTLPILAWGKQQGGIVGYSHSGWGLALPEVLPGGKRIPHSRRKEQPESRPREELPDYAMPPFDGIGANEYIVTVAHDVCDFISAVDTPAIWELNIWYHTLNCGFRARISGETDFPCIYGERVGLGRVYAKLDEGQPLNFDTWITAVKNGRSYCGDGLSHIFDLRAASVADPTRTVNLGEPGSGERISQLDLASPGAIRVSMEVAALLAATPNEDTESIRNRRIDEKPYWHIERARIGDTREVPVELLVNAYPVATMNIVANGKTSVLNFDIHIEHSSWIAVRIYPSAHTNPIFIEVAGKPIRASRRSARWCAEAVDVCWNSKKGKIRVDEQGAAKAAYDQAKKTYLKILGESVAD